MRSIVIACSDIRHPELLMPYYGAPSKGCEACRSRKVKVRPHSVSALPLLEHEPTPQTLQQCDGGRPTCDRCAQSGRQCPGYRELGAVIFRDENGRIVRRATARRGAVADGNSTTVAADDEGVQKEEVQANSRRNAAIKVRGWRVSDVAGQRQQSKKHSRPKGGGELPIATSLPTATVHMRIGANEGISFFRREFCWEAVGMHFDSWRSISPDLLSITSAFGLALLSFARRSPELRAKAYNEYGAALKLANASLSQPEKARSDTTLAVVVLLSFFEVRFSSP